MDEKAVKKEFRHIVRVSNTDLDGSKPIKHSLRKINGVNFMFANALCTFANIDKQKITGTLAPAEINRLEEILKSPAKYGFPSWMLNRRNDLEEGSDKHLLGADLKWQLENDLKRMKRLKSYKGVRHMAGLPVRGQKTKSNFRDKKGKSLGVQKKNVAGQKPAAQPAQKPAAKSDKK